MTKSLPVTTQLEPSETDASAAIPEVLPGIQLSQQQWQALQALEAFVHSDEKNISTHGLCRHWQNHAAASAHYPLAAATRRQTDCAHSPKQQGDQSASGHGLSLGLRGRLHDLLQAARPQARD